MFNFNNNPIAIKTNDNPLRKSNKMTNILE